MTSSDTAVTPRPDPFARLRPASLAAVVANVAIVLTGGIVRVTGSGLGCPDWPACEGTSVVPTLAGEAVWHQVIEFGNRLLTGVLLAVAVAVVVAWRRDREELDDVPAAVHLRLARLVWLQPVGILGQAVLGGVTVLTDLNPVVVAAHFLLSMVLIAGAVALRHEVTPDPDTEVDAPVDGAAGRRIVLPTRIVAAVAAVVLVLGTVVTAAGPHAGDPGTPRLGVDIRTAALLHADAVWLLIGLTLAVLLAAHAVDLDRVRRAATILLAVELAQGGVGYVQYALGIPPALVSLHLLGAATVWVAAVRLALVQRRPWTPADPDPVPSAQRSHVTITA